ncbi:tripartite tricarboxylate transporter substrate binding protein [Achromobacter sp. F4_2707]|uniref:Bug family tripartite tricarboxylate transporter substrate binding protein n=1 Tax=Achromobacter sp. F4_2707 TaxID=3114286 RepID=UPI0039C749A9
MIRKTLLTLVAASFLVGMSLTGKAAASDYPSKPIRFIVPFNPGSGTDTSARFYAQKVSELAGVPVIVENRPGGNGFIAVRAVLDAPADGYTILVGSNSILATNTALFKELPYDPIKDFKPIAFIFKTPAVLAVPDESPFLTLDDLLAYAQANPGKLNYGTGSAGYQLVGEHFSQLTGTKAVNIPFKGAGETVTAVASKTVDYGFADITAAQALAQADRIRLLVIADDQPYPSVPNAVLAKDAGVPDFKIFLWVAVAASSQTPDDIMQKIEGYFDQVSRLPETGEFFAGFDLKPQFGGSEELQAFIKNEISLWNSVAQTADIEKQ